MKKILIVLAILAMASVASAADMTMTGTLPDADVADAIDWIQNVDYAQICWRPVEEGGLGYVKNQVGKPGEKACLGAYLSWSWKTAMDAYIANRDGSAAAATAVENAHKTSPVVTVE